MRAHRSQSIGHFNTLVAGSLIAMTALSALADVDVEIPNRAVVSGTLAARPIPGTEPATYRVHLPAGARLNVVAVAKGVTRRRSAERLGIRLLDADGNDLAANLVRSRGPRTSLRARVETSGEYRIQVLSQEGVGGDYSLTVRWKPRRRVRFSQELGAETSSVPFAADANQLATLVVRSSRRSGALPRLRDVRSGEQVVLDNFAPPSTTDARLHRADDLRLPTGGDLQLGIEDVGSGGTATGTITLRTPDSAPLLLDLTDDVLGEAHGGGAVAVGRLVGPVGATLVLTEQTGGRLAGAQLVVAAETVTGQQPIYIGSSDDVAAADPSLLAAGPTILVGPDDALLPSSATLTIPYDPDLAGPVASQLRVLQRSGNASQVLSIDDGIVVDTQAATVTLEIRRLGRFRVLTLGDPPPVESDLDGDGIADLVVRAPNSDTGRGAVYIYYGPLIGDATTSEASTTIRGQQSEAYFGWQFVTTDLDGDGRSELIVSQEAAEFGDGAVHVFANLTRGQTLTTEDAVARFSGVQGASETFGISVAVGDANDDGATDVLIGAENGGSNSAGRAYVFFGNPALAMRFDGERSASQADCRIFGPAPGDLLGSSVQMADVTGDGVADVLVASDQALRTATGRLYIFVGPLEDTTLFGDDAAITIAGQSVDSGFGLPVTCGDADGDGIDDILVGATNQNVVEPTLRIAAGRAYLFYGGAGVVALGTTGAAADADWVVDGQGEFDALGQDLRIGDVTGDGVSDLVVGVPYDSSRRLEAGSISIFEGSRTRGQIATTAATTFHGIGSLDTLTWIEPIVDLNGDGRTDLVTYAAGNSAGGKDSGACYVMYGGRIEPGERRVDAAASDSADLGLTILGTPGEYLGEAVLFFDF